MSQHDPAPVGEGRRPAQTPEQSPTERVVSHVIARLDQELALRTWQGDAEPPWVTGLVELLRDVGGRIALSAAGQPAAGRSGSDRIDELAEMLEAVVVRLDRMAGAEAAPARSSAPAADPRLGAVAKEVSRLGAEVAALTRALEAGATEGEGGAREAYAQGMPTEALRSIERRLARLERKVAAPPAWADPLLDRDNPPKWAVELASEVRALGDRLSRFLG